MPVIDAPLPRFEATLGGAFEASGVGLHTGRMSRLKAFPAPEGHGLRFVRATKRGVAEVPALWPNRRSRPLCTALQVDDGPLVRTVEHLLAALSALAIDNARIELDGEELPILDGSAAPWCERILAAGRVEQAAPRRYLKVRKRVAHAEKAHRLRIDPAERFELEVAITLSHFGQLKWIGRPTPDVFPRELAPSRSFGRLKWALPAKVLGFFMRFGEPVLRGASPDNVVALYGAGAVGGLRMPDEPVRHRALDLVGDLALAGHPLLGRVFASRPGHDPNFGLLSALMRDPQATELVTVGEDGALRRA